MNAIVKLIDYNRMVRFLKIERLETVDTRIGVSAFTGPDDLEPVEANSSPYRRARSAQ